jgi:hypothetical protein
MQLPGIFGISPNLSPMTVRNRSLRWLKPLRVGADDVVDHLLVTYEAARTSATLDAEVTCLAPARDSDSNPHPGERGSAAGELPVEAEFG